VHLSHAGPEQAQHSIAGDLCPSLSVMPES
jgi:hypothetical protein